MTNAQKPKQELGERYELACALAAKLYAEGKDTTEIDAECDRLQGELEAR